jgi:Tfp pilus assembly protein FimV
MTFLTRPYTLAFACLFFFSVGVSAFAAEKNSAMPSAPTAPAAPAAPTTTKAPLPSTPVTTIPGTYTPKSSDTLDKIIGLTLKDSPLRIEILRQAFISQNPTAFTGGKTLKVTKGLVLSVPDHDQLLLDTVGEKVQAIATIRHEASTNAEERKRWVRYP